jgi:hypothetical protein
METSGEKMKKETKLRIHNITAEAAWKTQYMPF